MYMGVLLRQPKKKALFSRSLREQKFSNANFRGENSVRFHADHFFTLRDFAEKIREKLAEKLRKLLRSFSAKFRADIPQKLGFILKNVNVPVNNYGHGETVS